ncbi:MAG: SIS domain-containing protein [Bacilli bacterium]|nr:SIS domain-containing protein [Bacilli bacterium]
MEKNLKQQIIDSFTSSLNRLADELRKNAETIDQESVLKAVELILACKGKLVITGVGKSGHVGKKIAASLSSMGTPAFFVHATEGVHGDLGMIQADDVVMMLSNSGETRELLALLPSLDKIGSKRISITRSHSSTLAKNVDVSLAYTYERESDHLGLAPTVSSSLTLAIGDALSVAICKAKGFSSEDFHLYHPGGSLGKQLEKK